MIRIIGFKEREGSKGKFNALVIQGDVEFVVSKDTGRIYATARTCSIPSTFDANVCESLVGKTMKGSIIKVECSDYEYTVPETGEIITLAHRYEYSPIEKGTMEEVVMNQPSFAFA